MSGYVLWFGGWTAVAAALIAAQVYCLRKGEAEDDYQRAMRYFDVGQGLFPVLVFVAVLICVSPIWMAS